jgi:hypothetical protein
LEERESKKNTNKMKKYFLFATFVLLAVNCFSQDYIYLKTGEVLETVIVHEGVITVRYRHFNDTSKKMYFVEKSDIVRIVFQDGKEKTYSSREEIQTRNDLDDKRESQTRNDFDYNRRNSDTYENRRQPQSNRRQNDYPETINNPRSQIHGGIVFPQVDIKEIFATGFNIGYKHYSPLSASNVSLVFGLDAFYNESNSEFESEWAYDVPSIVSENGSYADINPNSYPVFLNFAATGGFNFTYPVSDKLSVYGEIVGGINFSKMTNLEADFKFNRYSTNDDVGSIDVTFEPNFGFCYALGGGIIINNKLSIGLRYNDLNSYNYEIKGRARSSNGVNVSVRGDDEFKVYFMTNLTIALGILF